MIRDRLRTLIGAHPIRAIVIGCVTLCLPTFIASRAGLFDDLGIVPDPHAGILQDLAIAAMLLALPAIIAWSCLVGCILARAGLSVERAWTAPIWFIAGCWLAGIGALVLGSAGAISGAVCLTIAAIPCILTGLRLGEWLTHLLMRHGVWQPTLPVEPPDAAPPDTFKERP